ncbi:MAG TPA: YaaR family protein [Clostridiaceae bacterium]|nr:YaaR family protein [Clostridiaceae bacterium]
MSLKISGNSDRKPQNVSRRIDGNVKKVADRNELQFSSHMERHFSQNQDEELKKKALEIEKQGKHLSKHIDVAELKVYKRLVMEFLDEAVRGSSRFCKESFLDRRGRHRVFATIKIVNEKLEELTREVLKTERDNLVILSKIEDIRGLILDLLL